MESQEIKLNVNEALALIYCLKHISSDTTPTDLKKMYLQVKNEITSVKRSDLQQS